MTDKVIVTNMTALTVKYGGAMKEIRKAIRGLIAADKKRGLATRLVALDKPSDMKPLKAPIVVDAADPEENKRAIDGVYKSLQPDYLLILGALDVVPHQDLLNPVYDGDDDPDRFAFSDLPYACEAGYSRKPQDFIGPTRVVGRLPDVTGGTDAKFLVRLLNAAGKWRPVPRDAYEPHLGISTDTWKASTKLSLKNLFGSGDDLQIAPPKGPNWTAAQLKRRSHFINCHGAEADFRFYGEDASTGDQPVAHTARRLARRIAKGTVIAAECCYGSELYDPGLANGQNGICSVYLTNGAFGFVGSTTIAYGPDASNDDADLICQYFLGRVLEGSSLGRAFLEARQRFVQTYQDLDPVSVKTIAQFTLLGDPSIQPVVRSAPSAISAPGLGPKARTSSSKIAASRTARRERRRALAVSGVTLAETRSTAVRLRAPKVTRTMKKELETMARRARMRRPRVVSYAIRRPPVAVRAAREAKRTKTSEAPTGFQLVFGRKRTDGPVPRVVVLVAKVATGRILSARVVHRR